MAARKAPLTCGIIMPISHVDENHTSDHWGRVKHVISAAITAAGMEPKPVWQGGQHDVIQARILENIFENDVVVCDISTKNANVMLEWGMRLTTKRPTLAIAEIGTALPFDTGIINTMFYDASLEWNTTQQFISELADAIKEVADLDEKGEYRSYLETFKFERVEPGTVSVPANEMVLERLEDISSQVSKLSKKVVEVGRVASSTLPMLYRNGLQVTSDISDVARASPSITTMQTTPTSGTSIETLQQTVDSCHSKLMDTARFGVEPRQTKRKAEF